MSVYTCSNVLYFVKLYSLLTLLFSELNKKFRHCSTFQVFNCSCRSVFTGGGAQQPATLQGAQQPATLKVHNNQQSCRCTATSNAEGAQQPATLKVHNNQQRWRLLSNQQRCRCTATSNAEGAQQPAPLEVAQQPTTLEVHSRQLLL